MRAVFSVLVLSLVLLSAPALAARTIGPGDGPLQHIIDSAEPGSELLLTPGIYAGNLLIDKPISLLGQEGAIVDGGGQGDAIRVRAPNVRLQGLTVRGSGHNLTDMNAGIFVEVSAADIVIADNFLDRNAFGIWLNDSPRPKLHNNRIRGDISIRSQDRGNGIHVFNVRDGEIVGNTIWEARDGIYVELSRNNLIQGNLLYDNRYGMHYMFSEHDTIADNRSHDNRLGFALMMSRFLTITGNRSELDQNYGFLINSVTYSTISGNAVSEALSGTTPGGAGSHGIPGAEGKALFVYNSQYNEVYDNLFARSEIGIHLTAGSEGNKIYGNSFLHNRTQVMYIATRLQEWSVDGRGNYWSDYLGWDLSADGIGDLPYEPNDAVDRLLWQYPLAKVLMNSPAIQVLRWAQRQFPVLRPQGVRDSAPLMRSPHEATAPAEPVADSARRQEDIHS